MTNKNFTDTLYLFACGARGLEPETDLNLLDYKEIYKTAKLQAVWETVFLSIAKLNDKYPGVIPKDIFDQMNAEFILSCTFQYRRHDFMHRLFKKFDEKNIKYCVLKGESVARFYHTPIARVSGDVDILVEPEKLDLCLDIMKDAGFEIGEKEYSEHHVECRHSTTGLVEVHTGMYTKRTEEICFNNAVRYEEEHIKVTAEDGSAYNTLGITDGFVFVFLHFVKHFISKGTGMRQLGDVLLYIEKNYENIDWQRVDALLEELGFDKFFRCVVSIGKKYFSFPENIFVYNEKFDDELIEKVFDDMFGGGVFGHDDETRNGFYDNYLTERYKKYQNKNYESYKTKDKLKRLFPDREFMSKNFEYVNKSAALLPVAWVHRFAKNAFGKQEPQKFAAEHAERMELMNSLGMM